MFWLRLKNTLLIKTLINTFAFYLAEKKYESQLAKKKINFLCQYVKIAGNTSKRVFDTLSSKSTHDFEDGLEYYAVQSADCKCIIENFYFDEIEVLNCEEFFKRYLLN